MSGRTKGQTGIGSSLKRLRRWGQGLKSHQSGCLFFCGRVPWLYQYWPSGFMLFVVLCPGPPKGSTCSGFKASQKTGNGLKSHSIDWEKQGIEPATCGLQDKGLSPTPRWLLTDCMFAAMFLGCTSTGRVGLCFLCSFSRNSLRLNRQWFWFKNRLRRRGNGLKSHLTIWEKRGIEPASPWFTRHRFIPYTTATSNRLCFCGRVSRLYQYWPGGFVLFLVLCPGTTKGSTGSGSGFKTSQKTEQWLKVSSDKLGEAWN